MAENKQHQLLSGDTEDTQEEQFEPQLRPQTLAEYIGQNQLKHELEIYIKAARERAEALRNWRLQVSIRRVCPECS